MPTIPPLVTTEEERAELQRRVRAHTMPQRAAKRARVVLLAADGVPNRQIAPMVGMNQHTVAQWRRRFEAERLAGLEDRQRPGRPPAYGHDERLRILATVTEEPPDPASHWSHGQLAQALSDVGISASQIGRILADLDVKPHRVRSWITRPDDPGFWERAADICGLYLVPPTNALVLSVDEKTGMPARSRTRPPPDRRGGDQPARSTSTCATAPRSCWPSWTSTVAGPSPRPTWTATPPPTSSPSSRSWTPRSPPGSRCTWCWTTAPPTSPATPAGGSWTTPASTPLPPSHASWLNQVELFFSILARRLLKRGEFTSVEDLVGRVMAFIDDDDRTATPFRWTYDGRPLKAS
jgi:transposase